MALTLKDVMIIDSPTLGPDDSVATAVDLMIDCSVRNLPVVDGRGHLVGTFSTYRLMHLLLPVAASMDKGLNNLAFVQDTTEDVRERIEELRKHRIGEVMRTKDYPVVRVDTPLIEGALLLHKHRTRLPVVDAEGKLLGVVAYKEYLKLVQNVLRETD